MIQVDDLAAFLRGKWTIQRNVLDRDSGLSGAFSGTLTFADAPRLADRDDSDQDDAGLHYRENGTLAWAAQQTSAVRHYLLRPTDSPAAMDWFFADSLGNQAHFFHHMNLSSGKWSTEHPCSADLYEANYEVVSKDEIRVEWNVHGPTKNHLLRSVWTRAQYPDQKLTLVHAPTSGRRQHQTGNLLTEIRPNMSK